MEFKVSIFKEYTLVVLLVLFYMSEALNKYFIFSFGEETFLAKLLKGILILFCLIGIVLDKKIRHKLIMPLILILLFVLGQFFLSPNFNKLILVNVIKYTFPLVIFIYFNYKNQSNKAVIFLIEVFEKVVFINSLLILLGVAFNIYVLKTYGGSRFGFNGLLVSSATSTYFYSIALFNYFVKYKNRLFNDLKRIIVLVSILFVGTKSLYLFLFFIIFIFTLNFIDKKIKPFIVFVLSLMLIFLSYFFVFEFGVFNKISQENGILASITSYRSQIFTNEMLPFINKNWTLSNYLFGGINDITTRPQMAIFDLFYFFGAFGTVLYLFIYCKNYFCFKVGKMESYLFGLIFLISFVAGNFFINATVVVYMIILRESIRKYSLY